ncbi:MAG: FAD-dependent oxidoreductase [Acidobacteriota bacterium]
MKSSPSQIAVIGGGISGLCAAHWLARAGHQITLFEAASHLGGHTHTHDITLEEGGRQWAVDTGFIVFNGRTYPRFCALMEELGVAWQDSDMSFSVRSEGGAGSAPFEFSGSGFSGLFAQRSNLLSPSFYRLLWDILRFHVDAKRRLASGEIPETLGELLAAGRYGSRLGPHYVVPMGAAIWSSRVEQMLEFPAPLFLRFLENHGMLAVNNRPVWRVIEGGSRTYVPKLSASFADGVRLLTPVRSLRRDEEGAWVRWGEGGQEERFDSVVVATHSDQALELLQDADELEREILGAFPYQRNEAVLHTDISMLPQRRGAWAAWNYRLKADPGLPVSVTYNMNILQGLEAPVTFCVTLNDTDAIDPAKILRRMTYHHPVYTPLGAQTQARQDELNGRRRTYFCGAYWRNGFHEDGVESAAAVVKRFGIEP